MQKISNNDQGYEVIIDVIMKLIRLLSLFFIFLLNFYNAHSQEVELAKKAFKAPSGKIYPAHWGQPPLRQTRDRRVLPGGYGQGSGTLARWIQENLDADAKDPRRAKDKKNSKVSKIKELEEKIGEMKDFMERARFTPEGLAKYKVRLKKMENELNLLKLENQKNTKPKIPSFQEWVKDGKKIPEGLIFTGGSPWFNERTGKNRSPEEVYKIIFRKDPK